MSQLFSNELPETEMSTALEVRDVSPMALLQDAVREGMSPDQLAVLVGLQRDMAEDAAKRAYAEAMSDCQAEMPTVVADATNPDTGRKYPRFETIQETAKPIYTKHGFALTFTDAECPIQSWKRTACDCRHRLGHVTHHFIDMPVDGVTAKGNPIAKMNPVQGCVSTNSYAQKTLTCNIFNVTIAGKDNDGKAQSLPIDEGQVRTIEEWLVATSTNRQKFLDWVSAKVRGKVEKVSDMPDAVFDEAIDFFKRKQR